MNDILEAFKLAEENKIEDAYDKFTTLIDNNQFAVDARYSRAMLDISKIKKHTENTIEDLKYLIFKKTKYSKIAYSFLTLIYDELDQIDNVIVCARAAIKFNTPFMKEITFALARALTRTNDINNLKEALVLINKCLDNEDDADQMSYQICKCDILISLLDFSVAKQEIEKLVTDFGHSGVTYYLKARLALREYQHNNKSETLEDAINFAKIALQYEEDDFSTKIILIEAYTIKKEYNEAIKIIDSMKEYNSEEDIIMEKIKVYDEAKNFDEGLLLIKKYLKNNDSWKLRYMEGAFTLEVDSTISGKEYARTCFKKAYDIYPNQGIMYDIIKLNKSMNDEIDSYNYLKEKETTNKDGALFFNLAEVSFRLEKEYGEVNRYYRKSFETGYIEENEYYDSICNYTIQPQKFSKQIKRLEQLNLKSEYVWSRRKTAIRYIYKEDGYKQNLKKAKKIIEECIEKFGEDPCTISLLARCYELMKDNKKAYELYEKAYQIIRLKDEIDCDCTYGYFAHAYINEIGTNQDLDFAKELILTAIKINGTFTTSHVAYYYAYFYLMGYREFNGEFAKTLLEKNYPFYRYEISRIVLLKQVCQKLNQESQKLQDLLKDIDKYSKEDLKYYNENINEEISKPFWRNV